jgi:hypothetical protein
VCRLDGICFHDDVVVWGTGWKSLEGFIVPTVDMIPELVN